MNPLFDKIQSALIVWGLPRGTAKDRAAQLASALESLYPEESPLEVTKEIMSVARPGMNITPDGIDAVSNFIIDQLNLDS